jgi:CarboxypepD_reg-like domain
MKRLYILLLALHGTGLLFGQGGTIKGHIIDAQTNEALPYANIFVNNTTIGTATDIHGDFQIKDVPNGISELVISYVGYKLTQFKVEVINKDVDLGTVPIEQLKQELSNVEVKGTRDRVWEKQLKRFEKIFLGEDEAAASCKILNPWVIDFTEGEGRTLMARAGAPIQINNMALGYKVNFYLRDFISNDKGYVISGNVRFEEMITTNAAEALAWVQNRKNSYIRSDRHLFKAILENRIREEGLYLYQDIPGASNTTVRSPYFYTDLNKKIMPCDTTGIVTSEPSRDAFKISLSGRIEMHNQNDYARVRTFRDIPYSVSWIEFKNGFVLVNKEGIALNPGDVIISGDMNADRVARMLPLDYQSGKLVVVKKPTEVDISHLYEKIYVQTDKPYYYPGEPMWFSGFVNYHDQTFRDSLSRVAHVELIAPGKKILFSKKLKIDSGFVKGDFILPDTIRPGNYYLRAYTNLERNFGEEYLFLKRIPVIGITDQVDPKLAVSESRSDNFLKISSDKTQYQKREKIRLNFSVADSVGNPLAAVLSISVTDAKQVVPIDEVRTIKEFFPFTEARLDRKTSSLKYPVEFGIGFRGQFFNDKGKPEKTMLNVVEWQLRNMNLIETATDGSFVEDGMDFYDSVEFAFQALNFKNRAYGKVVVKKEETATMYFEESDARLKVLKTSSRQRILSDYEVPKDAIILKAITVKDKRESTSSESRPYGRPDYIVNAKDLVTASNNLFLILPGKVPGLVINEVNGTNGIEYIVRIGRASGLTVQSGSEPLVMVNDAPMSGRAGDILQRIDVGTIETIEVFTGINVLFGGAGVNGIISIYTKKDINEGREQKKAFQSVKIQGYSRSRFFSAPNYEDTYADHTPTDYRSTLYWNPRIKTNPTTGSASLEFFAADLQTRYRVVVEGVTQHNTPVRAEYYLTVENP